jgi:orotate phosphoribosyltransferase
MTAASDFAPLRPRLIALVKARSFRTGEFTLASGRKSHRYFNLKPTMMNPEGGYLCALGALATLEALKPDYVGGLEMGAVPVVSALAALSHARKAPLKTFFVRKAAKGHGAKQQLEGLADGESLQGKRVVIVEDVTTTGASALQAVEVARAAGATVEHIVTLLDREEGAKEALAAQGLELQAVLRALEFD